MNYIAENGCLVIKLTCKQATKLHFGIKTIDTFLTDCNDIICSSCNRLINPDNMYYLPSINDVLCEDCYEDFINCMIHYVDKDSINYEIRHFNNLCKRLKLNVSVKFENGNWIFEKLV